MREHARLTQLHGHDRQCAPVGCNILLTTFATISAGRAVLHEDKPDPVPCKEAVYGRPDVVPKTFANKTGIIVTSSNETVLGSRTAIHPDTKSKDSGRLALDPSRKVRSRPQARQSTWGCWYHGIMNKLMAIGSTGQGPGLSSGRPLHSAGLTAGVRVRKQVTRPGRDLGGRPYR